MQRLLKILNVFTRFILLFVVSVKVNNIVRIWTIQPLQVWELLSEQKVLYVQPDLCGECSFFPEAYSWMCQRMKERLPSYQGHLPWWGWHYPKPDLRHHSRRGINNVQEVRIELELPDSHVLLSYEAAWLVVLNGLFVACTDAESELWDQELEERGLNEWQRPLPEPWESRLVRSWDNIFDLNKRNNSGGWSDVVQATFEELRLTDVVAVKPFKVRSLITAS